MSLDLGSGQGLSLPLVGGFVHEGPYNSPELTSQLEQWLDARSEEQIEELYEAFQEGYEGPLEIEGFRGWLSAIVPRYGTTRLMDEGLTAEAQEQLFRQVIRKSEKDLLVCNNSTLSLGKAKQKTVVTCPEGVGVDAPNSDDINSNMLYNIPVRTPKSRTLKTLVGGGKKKKKRRTMVQSEGETRGDHLSSEGSDSDALTSRGAQNVYLTTPERGASAKRRRKVGGETPMKVWTPESSDQTQTPTVKARLAGREFHDPTAETRDAAGASRELVDTQKAGYKPSRMRSTKGAATITVNPIRKKVDLSLDLNPRVQMTNHDPILDPIDRSKTFNSARSKWTTLSTPEEMLRYISQVGLDPSRNRMVRVTQTAVQATLDVAAEEHMKADWEKLLEDHFEKGMRTVGMCLMAVNPFLVTENQVLFAWCLAGVSKEEVNCSDAVETLGKEVELHRALCKHLREENSRLGFARRRDAICFLRWVMSVIPDVVICACYQNLKVDPAAESRLLNLILDLHQKVPQEIEHGSFESQKKIEEIRRGLNRELTEGEKLNRGYSARGAYDAGTKKRAQYVSGIAGMDYNPFVNLVLMNAYFDYELSELLQFWAKTSFELGTAVASYPMFETMRSGQPEVPHSPEPKLSTLKMGLLDVQILTNQEIMWRLSKPSWLPHPNADMIDRIEEESVMSPNRDEDLTDLSVAFNLLFPKEQKSPSERREPDLMAGVCLNAEVRLSNHVCGQSTCVKTHAPHRGELTAWFGDIVEKDKSETEAIADCYGQNQVNVATALGFLSMVCDYDSLESLENSYEMLTAVSVETWQGVLNARYKNLPGWKVALVEEMALDKSGCYQKVKGRGGLIGSPSAPYCESLYPLHMTAVEVMTQRMLVDQPFSVPKAVKLSQMSRHSYRLLKKMFGAVNNERREDLRELWGEGLFELLEKNISEFERNNGVDGESAEENDALHQQMMELEPLLEASGSRNLKMIQSTHEEYPCHCLAQTWWYPEQSNLCLVWDVSEIASIGLPPAQGKVAILVVGSMLALRWMEANQAAYKNGEFPDAETLRSIDFMRRLDLFETACKLLKIPPRIKLIWSRSRYMPWCRAVMTSWLYQLTKNEMKRGNHAYKQCQMEVGPDAFMRPLWTQRNAVTSGWKRKVQFGKSSETMRKEGLAEDLMKNVSLSMHVSFCMNREPHVAPLPHTREKLDEQKDWLYAYNQVCELKKLSNDPEEDGDQVASVVSRATVVKPVKRLRDEMQ